MKVFVCAIFLLAVATSGLAAPGAVDNSIENDHGFSKFLGHCADSDDMITCITIKGITALNRASRSNKIELAPGVSFIRDQNVNVRNGKSLSENDIIESLPEKTEEKSGRLLDLVFDAASDFFSSHNLQIKMPTETKQELARAINEGRGKMKKFMGPLMMAVGAKLIAMIPIFLGGLALLAFKAVAVAKIAFVLALALGAAKLFGGGGGVLGKLGGGLGGGYNGWNSGAYGTPGTGGWSSGVAQYPYARSSNDANDAAYRGQIPVAAAATEE